MPPAESSRRSPRARTAILDATREVLAEVGWGHLTVEAVAARAGVGKQTIYRWWPNKGAVVLDALLDPAGGGVALPDTGDLADDLRTVMRAVVEEMNDPATDRLQRAVTAEIQLEEDLARQVVQRLLRPHTEATLVRLRRGVEAGQLRSDADLELAAELLFGPVFHRWLLRTAPLDPNYADRLVDTVLSGLAPRP